MLPDTDHLPADCADIDVGLLSNPKEDKDLDAHNHSHTYFLLGLVINFLFLTSGDHRTKNIQKW